MANEIETYNAVALASIATINGKADADIFRLNGFEFTAQFSFTISSNQTDANLRSLAIAAGWDGSSSVVATINSGISISSSGTGTPALTVNGSFPSGVALINGGTIAGRGGSGGHGGYYPGLAQPYRGLPGTVGGTGLAVSVSITITNNATIGGGGGGGGGGGLDSEDGGYDFGGGGGGGGAGFGALGAGGNSGLAGAAGSLSSGGGGGAGGSYGGYGYGGAGGGGGSLGVSGSGGSTGTLNMWGANGGAAGGGGGSITGNANITWVTTGTRLGAIS